MPAAVSVKYLGNREKEVRISSLLTAAFENYKGNWIVSVLGSPDNTLWELKINGADGRRTAKKFYGEDGERSIEAILAYAGTFAANPLRE